MNVGELIDMLQSMDRSKDVFVWDKYGGATIEADDVVDEGETSILIQYKDKE